MKDLFAWWWCGVRGSFEVLWPQGLGMLGLAAGHLAAKQWWAGGLAFAYFLLIVLVTPRAFQLGRLHEKKLHLAELDRRIEESLTRQRALEQLLRQVAFSAPRDARSSSRRGAVN